MSVKNRKMAAETWDDFNEPTSDRSLGLQVEKTFWVSREELAKISPVFHAMLFGEFKESKQDVIKLSDKTDEEILELLRALFTSKNGKKKPITGDNVEIMLKLGDEYEIKELMENCSTFLQSEIEAEDRIETDQMIQFFTMGIRYKLKKVVRSALRPFALMELALLVSYFDQMPFEVQYAILMLRGAAVGPFKHKMESVPQTTKWHCDNCCPGDPDELNELCCGEGCKYCKWAVCETCLMKNEDRWEASGEMRCSTCHNCGKTLYFLYEDDWNSEITICECMEKLAIAQLEKVGL